MKISHQWLMQYISEPVAVEDTAKMLTSCGLEVESYELFETIKGGLEGVVVGQVVEKVKHPNADRLSLTKVDIGTSKLLSIVCGAPNVEVGQKVMVATIGTKLPGKDGFFEIKLNKIRGEVSEGMICAEDELGIGESHAGIMVLDPNTKIGTTAKEYFQIYADTVYEIGLTPNRADAASHIGVARDLVAVINHSANKKLQLKKPNVTPFNIDKKDTAISIVINNPKECFRYTGLCLTGVRVGESPQWLKNFLLSIGAKPINNIVDITNFVLFEMGQPLHAFDYDKITSKKVVVKTLTAGTPFVTLDGVERKLSNEDLMICNDDVPMCMAGVFGGIDSGVTEKTTSIFLESACFNPVYIRKTSKLHNLKTDAAFRFERGTDPNITVYAIQRAANLIKEIAGGKISSEIIDVYPTPIHNFDINLNFHNLFKIAGKQIEKEKVIAILKDLEIEVKQEDKDTLLLSVPPFKVDVQREADVFEEILRIYGYDNIELPDNIKFNTQTAKKPDVHKMMEHISDYLCSHGFYETMANSLTKYEYAESYSFVNKDKTVKILNPISKDLEILRPNLIFSGLETLLYNMNRQQQDVKIFEFGKVYTYDEAERKSGNYLGCYKEEMMLGLFVTGKSENETWYYQERLADFYYVKAYLERILEKTGVKHTVVVENQEDNQLFNYSIAYFSGETQIAIVGKVSQNLLNRFDVKKEVYHAAISWDNIIKLTDLAKTKYKDIPKFPEVRRDLALTLDENINYSAIEKTILSLKLKQLKTINLFDVYQGKNLPQGKKSYAISLILQDMEKTLTDKETEEIVNKVVNKLSAELSITLR